MYLLIKCCSFGFLRNIKQHNFSILIEKFTFLQIFILEGFLKDHMTLKPGVMMLKIQLYHHKNKVYFKIVYFIVIIFDNITDLLYF